MAYSQDVYRRAIEVLDKRRESAYIKAQENFEKISAEIPQLEDVQRRLSQTGLKISKVFLYSDDKEADIKKLKAESLALQQEKAELLKKNGYSTADLEVPYTCKHCRDTGFIDSRLCNCHKEILKTIERSDLARLAPVEDCKFESFLLDERFYPDKALQRVEKIFNSCRSYAVNFTPSSKSILLLGGVGVGKTHLSLAIANVVINRGYSVVFGVSQNIIRDLQNERFNNNQVLQYCDRSVLNCDLLIIDDLGTEVQSPSSLAIIYNIINTRLLSKLPTIITSNYTLDELEDKYDQRILSRITGEYSVLTIDGNNVRYLK